MTDIFISFKNTYQGKKTLDSQIAQNICDKFKSMNYKVFMSNDSLRAKGSSNYKKKIDEALDEASCLIVVGSCKEFFEHEWVRYEWDTYLNEVLAGRKKENIFTFRLNGLQIGELPIGLRRYQSFDTEQEEQIYMWVDNALSQSEDIGKKYQFLYPAMFTETDEGYRADFLDLGIWTEGYNLSEAYLYAKDLLRVYLSYALRHEINYNSPTRYQEIAQQNPDKIVMYIDAVATKNDKPNLTEDE